MTNLQKRNISLISNTLEHLAAAMFFVILKKGDKRQQPTQCGCLNVYFLAIYFTL
jgi:hypothetical protein